MASNLKAVASNLLALGFSHPGLQKVTWPQVNAALVKSHPFYVKTQCKCSTEVCLSKLLYIKNSLPLCRKELDLCRSLQRFGDQTPIRTQGQDYRED